MGRRLNQYLGSFGDGRPKVVFVFDDEAAPADAEYVYRLNLKGRSADTPKVAVDVRGAVEPRSEYPRRCERPPHADPNSGWVWPR